LLFLPYSPQRGDPRKLETFYLCLSVVPKRQD